MSKVKDNRDLYLILPNIRSAFNVGAMFRTADACGFTKLFLVGYTAVPPHPKVAEVALGAETWVPFEHRDDLSTLITELRAKDFTIAALELSAKSQALSTISFNKSTALIVGNEVDGLSLEIQDQADLVIHLPMLGKKESLNVAIAAGIAMYHLAFISAQAEISPSNPKLQLS